MPQEKRCRHRLRRPEDAGHTSWDALREAAAEHPDLRPCPRHLGSKGTWQWIYRSTCNHCPDAVEIEEGREQQ